MSAKPGGERPKFMLQWSSHVDRADVGSSVSQGPIHWQQHLSNSGEIFESSDFSTSNDVASQGL